MQFAFWQLFSRLRNQNRDAGSIHFIECEAKELIADINKSKDWRAEDFVDGANHFQPGRINIVGSRVKGHSLRYHTPKSTDNVFYVTKIVNFPNIEDVITHLARHSTEIEKYHLVMTLEPRAGGGIDDLIIKPGETKKNR